MTARRLKVINVPHQDIDNRLSGVQIRIVEILSGLQKPTDCIGHLPTTGEMVERLGLPRTRSNVASVARSLSRLQRIGILAAWRGEIYMPGKAFRWSLNGEYGS